MTVLQAALTGVLVGGLYALMAAGLSVAWGVLRVINLAHFGLILLGAYLTFGLSTGWGIDPLLTVGLTAPLLFAVGAGLQWVYDRLRISEFGSLLVSFGLLIITIQLVSIAWSADFQRMTAAENPYATRSVEVGRLVFGVPTLLAFAVAVSLVLGADLVLRRTFFGRATRAFAQDRTVAAAFGIDGRRVGVLVAGAAGVTAAIAGMLFALESSLTPATAYEWFGVVFAVVILGGVGQVVGTLVAGVAVGVVSSVVSVLLSPAAAPFVLFSLIVLALLVRPQGLAGMAFPRRRARAGPA
jgi:branched-chain amino acid transport system permease protein